MLGFLQPVCVYSCVAYLCISSIFLKCCTCVGWNFPQYLLIYSCCAIDSVQLKVRHDSLEAYYVETEKWGTERRKCGQTKSESCITLKDNSIICTFWNFIMSAWISLKHYTVHSGVYKTERLHYSTSLLLLHYSASWTKIFAGVNHYMAKYE